MHREYCPKCKTIKNLRVSITKTTTKDKKGKIRETVITAYHCEECNSFIKSDEEKSRVESLHDILDYCSQR